MDTLPVELYRPIVQCIDRRGELAALALTSHIWQLEAERRLYCEIFLAGTIHVYDLTEGSHRKQKGDVPVSLGPLKSRLKQALSRPEQDDILQRLLSSPRLASYVRSLSVTLYNDAYDLIHRALQAMSNLKRLSIWPWDPYNLSKPLSAVVNGARFKLEYLDFWSEAQFEEADARFLEAQDELRELKWRQLSTIRGVSLVSAALDVRLPLLHTLEFRDRPIVRSLLAQQTVTQLCLDGLGNIFGPDDMGEVYTSVQSLILTRAIQVTHTAHFPNVVYLCLTVFPDLKPIHLLVRLQKILTPSPDDPHNAPAFKRCHSCSLDLFGANASLKQVAVRDAKFVFVFSTDDRPRKLLGTQYDPEEWRF